jgi:tetratricopeptide (TPR) repeat protein
MADPWSADASSLEDLLDRFQRARVLVDRLVAGSAANLDYAFARVHVYVKLGVVSHRLGRAEAAAGFYRRAILLEEGMIERSPSPPRSRCDRAVTQESLALLLLEKGLRAEARICVDAAAADLAHRVADTQMPPPRPDHFRRLAAIYQRLDEPSRAQEIVAAGRKHLARP